MCNMCNMCEKSINCVGDIISYVKNTEEYIRNLNDRIKSLKNEIKMIRNERKNRVYELLVQKEFIGYLKQEIQNLNVKNREIGYSFRVFNKLQEIEDNIDKELYDKAVR